jgi:membrane associated rhomboid family serine protease
MDQAGCSDLALHFRRWLLARHGFRPGPPPGATELEEASDDVLTLTDGLSVQILCVVACGTDPDRRFEIPPERVFDIAEACRAHAGNLSVFISIVEIALSSSKERRERLRRYVKRGLRSKVFVVAFTIEEGSGTVWTNAPLLAASQRRLFQSIIRKPPLLGDELAPQEVAVRDPAFPIATALTIAGLTGVFVLEMTHGIGPPENAISPSLETLVGFGGLVKPAFWAGEWHRLGLAPLLHGHALHLFFNALALWFGGRAFERLVGPAWFAATFVLCALGGACGSLLWLPDDRVGIGASGAIIGILAAGFVCTHRLTRGPERSRLQVTFSMLLVAAFVPQQGAGSMIIDFGGHGGGAITGGLVGSFLLRGWPDSMPLPRFRTGAIAVVAAGAVGLAAASVPAWQRYRQDLAAIGSMSRDQIDEARRRARLARHLVPDHRNPGPNAVWLEQADQLVVEYPKDPRVRLARAVKLAKADAFPQADLELREGLAQEEILRSLLKPDTEAALRATLALVLDAQNKPEAVKVAGTVCGKVREEVQRELVKKQLCP